MKDPRVCVVGAGHLSSRRIYPYLGAVGAVLVGVCDLDPTKAAVMARRFGGRSYPDVLRMMEAERPDGVIICTGPGSHAALARLVLQAGFPVYTEKPPALTAAATLEVARVAHAAGRLCMTAFKKRHTTAYLRAKEWLAGFAPADRLSLSIDFCSAPYANDVPERDFLLDFGIHAVDLAAYLFGEVTAVAAFARDRDAYAVSLRFAGGAVGTLTLAAGRSFILPTEEVEISVRGGHAMTVHNSSTWRIGAGDRGVEWREPPTFTSAGESGNDTGHRAELECFVHALRENRTRTISDICESYKTMVLYEAIVQAVAGGGIVTPVYAPLPA